MFRIRIPVFIVSFLHLDNQLSPQGSDLHKPFPKFILAHSATVLLHNMALIITSKKNNKSYLFYHCLCSSWFSYLLVLLP